MGLAVLLAVLALTLGVGVRYGRARVNRDAAAARSAVAHGRYAQARAPLERWLVSSPKDPEAHYLRARVGLALGLQDEMTAGDRRARELDYPEIELALLRAILAAKQKHSVQSEPILRAAFDRKNGPDALLDEALAQVYIETYNLTKGYEVIAVWMREAPDDARPYLWRAEIDRRFVGREKELLVDYQEALRRDPSSSKARLGLAEQLRAAHRNEDAAVEFAAYLAAQPNDARGHLGAGWNALESGAIEAAKNSFEQALRLDPKNAAAHKGLGDIAFRLRNDVDALSHFDAAIRLDPFELDYRYTRGLALYRLGRFAEADAERDATNRLRAEYDVLNTLQARLRQTPDDPAVELQLARWLVAHGKDKEGTRWAQKILTEQPRNREANRLLADHYQREGNVGLANYYLLNASETPGGAASH